MESSVKTISRPVIGRLPVTQLDEFACRQLDRVRDHFFLIADRLVVHRLSAETSFVDQTSDLRRRLVYLTCFRHSSAGMAAAPRGHPSKKSARIKWRPRHRNENLVLDRVLKGREGPVVPLLPDRKLNNMRLSRGVVGKPCSLKLVDSGQP